MDTLTATALATMRTCPRKYYLRYQLAWGTERTATPLRFGSAYHAGLEAYNKTGDEALAVTAAIVSYTNTPDWAEPDQWIEEAIDVEELVRGHIWRYGQDTARPVEAERVFVMPITNPETGRASKTFELRGKMDLISELEAMRLALNEYKTADDDIADGSDYWPRIRFDQQISIYVIAARHIGYDVQTVLYDVARKPRIGRRTKRQPETLDEYQERLRNDIRERPDFYFNRKEVARLESDLAEIRWELWQQAQAIMDARKNARWFRNVSKNTCNFCEYREPCLENRAIVPGQPWQGFVQLTTPHPELEEQHAGTIGTIGTTV